MSRIRRPSPALAVATAALVVALGGVTYASIPGPDGTVHSCLGSRGALRVIDSDATCVQGETALDFAQKGPQGAQGPAGAAGETRLLNFTRSGAIQVPRKAGTPVGSFDLPEGSWAVTFTGGVRIPGSEALSLNFTRGQKLHSAAQVDFFRARAIVPGPHVTCTMSFGDGSVRQVVGNNTLIGLLVPAVQSQHGSGGGAGRGSDATISMNLLGNVPAGGERGFLACNQGKPAKGFSTPAAQLHDISIHAVQVQEVGELNFTPAR